MFKAWKKKKEKQGYDVGLSFVETSGAEAAMEKLRKFTYQGNIKTPFNKGMVKGLEDGLEKKMAQEKQKLHQEQKMKEIKDAQKKQLEENRLKEIEELRKQNEQQRNLEQGKTIH